MKLTVFAATGRIGALVVARALADGHDVTAVARDTTRITSPVRTVAADLTSADRAALAGVLAGAVAGGDAVISALGPRTRADAGVTAPGTRAIAAAMRAAGVDRLAVVSAAPLTPVPSPDRPHPPKYDPGDGPVMRYVGGPLARRMLAAHYADLAEMEDVLRASGLDWTAVRPPRLTNGPFTGRYRVAYGRNIRGGVTISRADVADYLLRSLTDPRATRQTVGVAR